jgi:DNA-directed RNA polymerase specialized sigma24 family protein
LVVADDGEVMRVADLLPSVDAGPDAELVRRRLVAEIERALNELPEEQRAVFVAHELEGQSFKSMASQTGVNVNTLLARKRYAVLHLRKRLQHAFDEMRDRAGG